MARSSNDYIPRPDGDFSAWLEQYWEYLKFWWDKQGLDTAELAALELAVQEWRVAYPAHTTAQAAAEGARQAKDSARTALEQQIRPITRFVQSWPKTTDANRAEMGITISGTSRTPGGGPTTRPLAIVDGAQRLTHQLRLVDESTPTRRARPAGVLGAEVWVKLAEPNGQSANGQMVKLKAVDADASPAAAAAGDPANFTFLTMTTKPSFRATFKPAEGGKTAIYMARWVNTRGEKGPWSEIATATVAA